MTERSDAATDWDAFADRLRARFRNRPLYEFLDFELVRVELDRAILRLPYRERYDNGGGSVHGGILATLADAAVACALSTNFDGRMGFATSNLTIHYLSRARDAVTIDARIIKKGRRICVGTVEITDESGHPVAFVTCDFALTTSSLPRQS